MKKDNKIHQHELQTVQDSECDEAGADDGESGDGSDGSDSSDDSSGSAGSIFYENPEVAKAMKRGDKTEVEYMEKLRRPSAPISPEVSAAAVATPPPKAPTAALETPTPVSPAPGPKNTNHGVCIPDRCFHQF